MLFILLCLLLPLQWNLLELVVAKDDGVIKPGEILRPSDQKSWVSPGKNFSFGFHSSNGLYVLGVFFSAVDNNTLIWTAAINGSSVRVGENALVHFQTDGNFVLQNGSSTLALWQTNTGNSGVVSALMQDNGNFVLCNSTSSCSNSTVWESFENPTDTLVVDQKLHTGQSLNVYPYTFFLASIGNMSLKWKNYTTYWNQGNKNGSYVTLNNRGQFGLYNSLGASLWRENANDFTDVSVTYRFIRLEANGNLRSYGWSTKSQAWQLDWSAIDNPCEVFGLCGNLGVCMLNDTGPYCMCPSLNFVQVDPTDSTKGCKRIQDITNCSDNQVMVVLNHTEFFSSEAQAHANTVEGNPDCRTNCLNSQLCSASTLVSDGSSVCRYKTESFVSAYHSPTLPSISFVKVCGPAQLYSPPSASIEVVRSNKRAKNTVVGAVVGSIISMVVLNFCVCYLCYRSKKRFGFGHVPDQYTLLQYASGAPVRFTFRELQQATRNFKEKLGSGGFGTVYKGELTNKMIVAVKQLEGIEQGEKQFAMEVAVISGTHHLNLVKLIGFCLEGRHRLLVYEFMKNSSLDSFIFPSSKRSTLLDWETRHRIALGTAKAIAYLHEECRDCIIHCDIKPENILLDENFNPKVSDFGLSKLLKSNGNNKLMLASIHGTRGYMAPEWLANLPITSKSDVYSYGMVLLEIISGKRSFELIASTRMKFSTWASMEFESGNIQGIADERLGESFSIEQLMRAAQVSFLCIREQPSQRPSMGSVVKMLEGLLSCDDVVFTPSIEASKSSSRVIMSDPTGSKIARNEAVSLFSLQE